ncbi:MAG: DNA-directed DNA polymerase [Candidatus Micrarchaeia archaeon]|jgi:DNA polymerase I
MPRQAFFIDCDSVSRKGKTAIRLFLKDAQSGAAFPAYDSRFLPYFLLSPKTKAAGEWGSEKFSQFKDSLLQLDADIKMAGRLQIGRIKRVEETELLSRWKKIRLLKIHCSHPSFVPVFAKRLEEFGDAYSHDIPFHFRYVIDKAIVPNSLVEIDGEQVSESRPGMELKSVKSAIGTADETAPLRVLSLDIETYNPTGVVQPSHDPCIMISLADKDGALVLTHTKKISEKFVKCFPDEKSMLEALCDEVRQRHADLLCTYNGDSFDLPYLKERARATRAKFKLGRDRAPIRVKKLAMRSKSSIGGRVHFDVFSAMSFLNIVGAIRLPRLTLDAAYREILGGKKVDLDHTDIWASWETGKALEKLAEYSKVDAIACFDLAKYALPLELELSRLVGMPFFDASRASSGQLVEFLLLRESHASNELVPNKPSGSQVAARSQNPIQGAFVKMPQAGVYENIAVLDFRSLYPSIIISHNIDPSALNCECCTTEESFVSPQGHRFCAKRKGLIPRVLERVLDSRIATKTEMKKLAKESAEYRQLDARQFALKVLANSFYGYTAYARSRWYSRECGESTTAFARQYIMETIDKAEKAGFKVLYSDTDSIFLVHEKGKENSVLDFQKKVNSELPGRMELELEDFYPRGIFVGKKLAGKHVDGEEETGAKKKYALINKSGKIKIRGFELVRRDWSKIARNTQRRVLEALLSEGDVQKAVALVRDAIALLKSGKAPLEEVTIMTQLQKKTGSYEIVSPEVSAALKARKAGIKVPEGAVLQFVVTREGKTISEKAQVLELAKDYDADYYVNNQIIPAVLKILGAFGIDAEQLKTGKSQSSLSDW